MTPENKNKVLKYIDDISCKGGTNLFAAFKNPCTEMRYRSDKSRNGHVLLFTDGKEQCASGFFDDVSELKATRDTFGFKFPLHVFGFGMYDAIDSDYLHKCARNYDGIFGYIPDAVHLGTTFVNGIANIMSTCVHFLDLTLKFPQGTEIEHLMVGSRHHSVSKERN